jgi:hypothetical protein
MRCAAAISGSDDDVIGDEYRDLIVEDQIIGDQVIVECKVVRRADRRTSPAIRNDSPAAGKPLSLLITSAGQK